MIEIMQMSPKRRILSIIFLVVTFSIAFLIVIVLSTKKMNDYFKRTSEITYKDRLDLRVEKTWFNRGYLFFNDKYYLFSPKVIQLNIDFLQINDLETPLNLKKISSSDTIRLFQNDSTYVLLLKSQR
jgi:hypothetical protein